MSTDGRSHTFSSVTVGGDGRAHLGDIYTVQYSAYNAREAVYQNTLATTIRHVLMSKDLQRALLAAIDVECATVSLDERSRMLKELETLLSRLQEMEQRGLSDNSGMRLDFLEAAEGDFKTSEYKKAAGKTLRHIETLARKTCTSSQSEVCLDELCGLVDRMSRQISARLCVAEAISGLASDAGSRKGNATDRTPLLLPNSVRQTVASVDAAEYVYASQDFWRQVALVLKEIMVKDHQYNFTSLFGYLVVLAIAGIAALTFMIVMAMTDAPADARNTFPLVVFVFFFFGAACFWTLIIVLRACGYEAESSNSERDINRANVVDGIA